MELLKKKKKALHLFLFPHPQIPSFFLIYAPPIRQVASKFLIV